VSACHRTCETSSSAQGCIGPTGAAEEEASTTTTTGFQRCCSWVLYAAEQLRAQRPRVSWMLHDRCGAPGAPPLCDPPRVLCARGALLRLLHPRVPAQQHRPSRPRPLRRSCLHCRPSCASSLLPVGVSVAVLALQLAHSPCFRADSTKQFFPATNVSKGNANSHYSLPDNHRALRSSQAHSRGVHAHNSTEASLETNASTDIPSSLCNHHCSQCWTDPD